MFRSPSGIHPENVYCTNSRTILIPVFTMTKKQIAPADFAELLQEDQLELLRRDGVFVGKLKKDGQFIILLQLYSFYVEIYYKEYRKTISEIRISENMDVLQPYLDQIKIKDLNKNNDNKDL